MRWNSDMENRYSLAQGTEIELAVVFSNIDTESLYWQIEFVVTVRF